MKWTNLAEDALTRKQARKALRKVAKHSLKLAKLESLAYAELNLLQTYAELNREEQPNDQPNPRCCPPEGNR